MKKRLGPELKGNKYSTKSDEGGFAGWVNELADETQFLLVKSLSGDKTGLWERSTAHVAAGHPDGEVFVNGPKVVKVAQTPGVVAAFINGRIDYATDEDVAPWEEHQHKAAEREARVVAEKREMVMAEAKKRARELYVESVGTDVGFEEAYSARRAA
jgi:hypothetical protein